ncbi:glutaredoxin-1-like [Oncorhynchus clarkii lewisi]|uniref:glutaredoxin-1-like n=1 Tax=Oncorhynchus clarkii lewisi TaxID=490388 RepID=UPI0039B8AB76
MDRIKGDIDKVVLFLKPSCPYCIIANDVLSKYGFKSGHLIQDYLNKVTGARTVSGRIFHRICSKAEEGKLLITLESPASPCGCKEKDRR